MNRTLTIGGVTLGTLLALGGTAYAASAYTASHQPARPAAAATHKAKATPPAPKIIVRPKITVTVPPAPAAPQAQAPAAPANPQLTNGVSVVLQFYADLNSHNYAAAWNLGGFNIGGSDYNGWVAGYATTASIDVSSYGTWNDGTVWADISATQTDGSVRTYSGTYTVSNGAIVSANISQTS